jgi:hypothetical protein
VSDERVLEVQADGCVGCPFLDGGWVASLRCKLGSDVRIQARPLPHPKKRGKKCPLLAGDVRVHKREAI